MLGYGPDGSRIQVDQLPSTGVPAITLGQLALVASTPGFASAHQLSVTHKYEQSQQTMVFVSLLLPCNVTRVRMRAEVALQSNAYTSCVTTQ